LAAFAFVETLVTPAAALSVLVLAEAEDSAAMLALLLFLFLPPLLLPWLAAFTFVETLVTPAAALSVLVPAEAEDSAAMLTLETEVDAATAVSMLVETLFWPEPPLFLAALAWRMLAQRANTYGDLWKIIVSELRGVQIGNRVSGSSRTSQRRKKENRQRRVSLGLLSRRLVEGMEVKSRSTRS